MEESGLHYVKDKQLSTLKVICLPFAMELQRIQQSGRKGIEYCKEFKIDLLFLPNVKRSWKHKVKHIVCSGFCLNVIMVYNIINSEYYWIDQKHLI